jgi:hypothetical protein
MMAQRWWLVAVAGWVAGLMLALGLMLPLAWRPWLRALRGRRAAAAAPAAAAAGRGIAAAARQPAMHTRIRSQQVVAAGACCWLLLWYEYRKSALNQ